MKKIYIYPTKLQRSWKIIFLLILNSAFSIHHSFSQTAPGIEWQNTIGGDDADELLIVKQTVDGGYILGGGSKSNISGDKTENCNGNWDFWIVKTNAAGNIQWQNTIGGNNFDALFSVQQTTDGGYILGGSSSSDSSGDKTENNWDSTLNSSDYWIVKTDSLGNIQWQHTIGGSGDDNLNSIQQTNDGGYIFGGGSNSDSSGNKTENSIGDYDYWIVKTDSMGNIEWQNTIGGNSGEVLFSIQQTTDGGYILGGGSVSNISGDKTENSKGLDDFWILKTDALGNIQWQKTIGGSSYDEFSSIQQTADGGYILGGWSDSNISGDKMENSMGSTDYWIVKTDSTGNIQWQNTIGGNSNDEFSSIRQTTDSGYILGGSSRSNISGDKTENSINGGWDYWILKTDSIGNIKWQNTIGGNYNERFSFIQQTTDGGYILGGYSDSDISGDKTENCNGWYDYWIVKLFPDTITGISNYQFSTFNSQFSPNPFTTQSKLTFKNPNKEKFLFTLYHITGRVTESVSTTNNEIILTKGSKPAGVYLFNLVNEKTGERWNGKIVISEQR